MAGQLNKSLYVYKTLLDSIRVVSEENGLLKCAVLVEKFLPNRGRIEGHRSPSRIKHMISVQRQLSELHSCCIPAQRSPEAAS
jgi:hypothetical protein